LPQRYHQCHQMSALPVSTRDTNQNHHLYSDTVLCSNVSIYHQYYNKLEIWGAQFEAARHRKSDWKYNLVGCSVCKNLRQQHPLQPKYTSGKSSFGWVNIYALNLFVSGPKCTNFFSPNFRNQNQNLNNFIPNFAYFGPKISYGTAPKFLDLDYKVHPNIYHILKFHANQPSKLEDPGEINKKLKNHK